MPSLKVLVATVRTQGRRANDFTHVNGPELVDVEMACDRHADNPDGVCGCSRAFAGLDSGRCTTTAEIAERDLTLAQYRDLFHRSLIAAGLPATEHLRRDAEQSAEALARVAARWPVGTVVERRGDTIAVRAWPTATTTGQRG